ncbi:MAG TPA: hypothetical protein VE907_11560 [Gammaproteobacteria bacterium]|nr:hypothetical protein [Gammaproteobacteria bacterium]
MIVGLPDALMGDGFAALLEPPGPAHLIIAPINDPKTGGWVGHVEEPLGLYIQRVSVVENFSQRPPFDHVTDPIYKRLIRDFMAGAVMPESKVAALSRSASDGKTHSLNEPDINFSVIDGLQRLYCYCIALLVVWRRDQLVRDGALPADSWAYFEEQVAELGDHRAATADLLKRTTRYEIFYEIDLAGLLHYMVTFNTGQRRMSLNVQLEIMQRPLIDELEQRAKIPVWHEIQKRPGMQRPKEQFAASELVLATQAFITNNAQLTASTEAERFLNEDQAYLDNVGDIADVVHTLKRIATEIHPMVARVYAADPTRRFILSSGGTFFQSLVAACGYVRNRSGRKALDLAIDKLDALFKRPDEDPLRLDEYWRALAGITASRGKATRRLVYDTFLRFFGGATTELEWLDTSAQITGSS